MIRPFFDIVKKYKNKTFVVDAEFGKDKRIIDNVVSAVQTKNLHNLGITIAARNPALACTQFRQIHEVLDNVTVKFVAGADYDYTQPSGYEPHDIGLALDFLKQPLTTPVRATTHQQTHQTYRFLAKKIPSSQLIIATHNSDNWDQLNNDQKPSTIAVLFGAHHHPGLAQFKNKLVYIPVNPANCLAGSLVNKYTQRRMHEFMGKHSGLRDCMRFSPKFLAQALVFISDIIKESIYKEQIIHFMVTYCQSLLAMIEKDLFSVKEKDLPKVIEQLQHQGFEPFLNVLYQEDSPQDQQYNLAHFDNFIKALDAEFPDNSFFYAIKASTFGMDK